MWSLLHPACVKSSMGCVVIFGIRYVRFAVNLVCANKSRGGPFETLNLLRETLYQEYVTANNAYEICHFVGLKKSFKRPQLYLFFFKSAN